MSPSTFPLLVAAILCTLPSAVQCQNATAQPCIQTIDELENFETAFGANDPTFSQGRTYVLCSNAFYNIGKLDVNNNVIDGQQFIRARPNLYLKCGDDGKVTNNCFITGGDVQVDGTSYFGNTVTAIPNVTIEGVTFSKTLRYSVWASKQGDITFVDCVFTLNSEALAPVFLEYYSSSDISSELSVSFIGCSFTNNTYYGDGANPAIVTANGVQNRLSFSQSAFENNDYIFNNTKFQTASFLVESSGPLSMMLNCFSNNLVGVSPVASYGGDIESTDNYGTSSNGTVCQFISSFESSSQFDSFTPTCTTFESMTDCLAYSTAVPSASPSMDISDSPSIVPTTVPSFIASLSPSRSPTRRGDTKAPTGSPSSVPSMDPTISMSPTSKTQKPSISSEPSFSPASPAPSNPATIQPITSDCSKLVISTFANAITLIVVMIAL